MRRKILSNIFICVFASILIISMRPENIQAETSPILNNGEKWRIGYYEGGPYSDYTDTMRTFIRGLISLGWIEDRMLPVLKGRTPRPYWDWLVRCESDYLSFKKEDSYSADWDDAKRRKNTKDILKKLQSGSLDLIIAMGTKAGQDLANDKHSVPTLVLSTTDAIRAGIIKSADDSGYDHVTARIDTTQYLRQIRMFHRIVKFKSLGLAYQNTPEGLIHSAFDDVKRIADERGFSVVTCEVLDMTVDLEKEDQSCLQCFSQLAEKVDAVYITALNCVDRQIEMIAEFFKIKKIPSFSMSGTKYVKKGLMLSISSDSGHEKQGIYNAKKFAQILNGAKPRSLDQNLKSPLNIVVNMDTVQRIEFKMPKSILKISNEIYEK